MLSPYAIGLAVCPLASSGLVDLIFRLCLMNNATAIPMTASTANGTPTPMPIFAPVLNPSLLSPAFGGVLLVETAADAPDVLEVEIEVEVEAEDEGLLRLYVGFLSTGIY